MLVNLGTNTYTTKNTLTDTTNIFNTHNETHNTNLHEDILHGILIGGNKYTENGNFNTGYQNFKLMDLATNTYTTKNTLTDTTNIFNTHNETHNTNLHEDILHGILIGGNKYTENGNFNTGYQNFKLMNLGTNTYTTKNTLTDTTNIFNTHNETHNTNLHEDILHGTLIGGNKYTENGNFNTGYQSFKIWR